jgi:prepilin-type N-terminal cleavage/methylation domain-containing protein
MNLLRIVTPKSQPNARFRRAASVGFTLIELMIAMTVFLVIGGAAMSLFRQHAALFNDQQYQIGLNVSLRNALSQMEADVVNAGTGWYSVANISSWPVGVTIINNNAGGATCHPTGTATYNAACFDTLNIVTPDPNTPPGQVYVAPGTVSCAAPALTTSGTMLMSAVAPATAAQLISGTAAGGGFTSGSQVVFIHVGTSGTQMTTAILSASAVASGANVAITYGATAANGTNSSTANDALNLTTNVDTTITPSPLTDSFCSGTDWVVKLAPVQYSVSTALDPTGPTLVRTENGTTNAVASQIIGFKVGASTVVLNGSTVSTSSAAYCFNSASSTSPCYDNQFDEVRSIRISLIGRTPPGVYSNANAYKTAVFTNTFDGQSYKIQALSIIVNPRNLSMND